MATRMVECVARPANKKIAFLNYKIVEESIKRVSLKSDVD